MRARIGIDGGLACSQRPTGVEHYARSLLRELLKRGSDRVDWFVYLPPYQDLGSGFPPHVRLRNRPDVNTGVKGPWLAAQSWRDRLDVLYTPGHQPAAGCRGRKVLTVYDTAFDHYPDCYPPGAAVRAHEEVSLACRRAARIAVPSEETRRGLVDAYGYPGERVEVIGAGCRPEFTPGEPGPLPDRFLAAGVRAPFFLCVGRLDRRKNIARVIEAYRMTLRAGATCGGLVVVGPDDTGTPDLRAALDGNRVEGERIVITGYVTEQELVGLYRAAAALVYPSLAEGFGLPVLEAMASGTPVITSGVSSLPEVAGEAALLVDPNASEAIALAMHRLLYEPALRERLSAAGVRRASGFTWTRTAERLLAVLLAAAKQPGVGRERASGWRSL